MLLIAAVAIVYAGTLHVPYLLDDHLSLATNGTLARWSTALFPPPSAGVGGRPLLNLSFAANTIWAHGSLAALHGVNILIHSVAACLLFALLRRMVTHGSWSKFDHADLAGGALQPAPTALPLTIALLWAMHPVQTEAVTYLSQRAESLMGMFYLLVMYASVRGRCSLLDNGAGGQATASRSEDAARPRWNLLAVLACLAGMATKEVMVTAPIAVLLYDRAFLSGSFREALRRRPGFYAALAAIWVPLLWLLSGVGQRHAGFGLGASAGAYALTECGVVLRYLRLIFWPHPLVFDYALQPVAGWAHLWPAVVGIAALLAVTLVACVRWPRAGFALAWFFLLLAPTSSFVPLPTQPMAESRLYLPLLGPIALATFAVWRACGRPALAALFVGAAAAAFIAVARNRDYRTDLTLWADTVAKNPSSARAHSSLAYALSRTGRTADALREDDAALALDPAFAEARFNRGNLLATLPGREADALADLDAAVASRPDLDSPGPRRNRAALEFNLGNNLKATANPDAAIVHYGAALRLRPDWPEAHNNLGSALLAAGRPREAVAEYETALRLRPGYLNARLNLNVARAQARALERDGR